MIHYVALRVVKLDGKGFGVGDCLTDADIGNKVLEKRLLEIRKIAPDPRYATGVQKYVVVEGQGLTYAGKRYGYGDTITSTDIASPVRERQMVAARRIAPVYGDLPGEEVQETPQVEVMASEPRALQRQRGRPRRPVH